MSSIVAIVGRPNVGKSTFFNRMIQRREAIVDSISGVTRDRNYGKSFWNGKEFSLIDTGGYLIGSKDIFVKEIDKQVNLAIEESDLIIFMVDSESGITGMDQEVAKLLKAECTPEFYLYDKLKKLVYRGRLDGSSPGNDLEIDGKDLRSAVNALISGKKINTEQFPSMGCNIKWK